MVIEAIQNLAQLLSKPSAFTTINAQRQAADQLGLAPGQQVQAEILSSLPDQRFLARIAGELFRIELPVIVQPGETLQLTFVSGEPRPLFTLSRSENSSAPVSISDAAKLLGELALNPADRQQAASLIRGAPLLAGPPVDARILGGLLRDALAFNGIFYESHLLQWFLGKRCLEEILKEPQGRLSNRLKSAKTGRPPSNHPESDEKASPEELEEAGTAEMLSLDEQSETGVAVNPLTIPLIREQLGALNSGQVTWQGQVWPMQQMEWSVSEKKGEAGEGKEKGKGWQSILRLELPSLGKVEATLRVEKEGLSLWIRTGRKETSGIMREEKEVLERALARTGVRLLNLVIEHEEE